MKQKGEAMRYIPFPNAKTMGRLFHEYDEYIDYMEEVDYKPKRTDYVTLLLAIELIGEREIQMYFTPKWLTVYMYKPTPNEDSVNIVSVDDVQRINKHLIYRVTGQKEVLKW